jgi:hypothetical protein
VTIPEPRTPYVDPAELAAALGVDPDDARLLRVVGATNAIIDAYYGADTVAAKLVAAPWPDAVTEAALTIGSDVWRRTTTPGGYFQVADFVGRLSADPTSSVAVLLDSIGREWWPIA